MLSRIEVRVQLCPPFLILHSSSDGTAHTAPHHRTQSHPRHSEASSPVMSFDRFSLRLRIPPPTSPPPHSHTRSATLAHPLRPPPATAHTAPPTMPTAHPPNHQRVELSMTVSAPWCPPLPCSLLCSLSPGFEDRSHSMHSPYLLDSLFSNKTLIMMMMMGPCQTAPPKKTTVHRAAPPPCPATHAHTVETL